MKNILKDLELNVLETNLTPIGRWYFIENKDPHVKGHTFINSYISYEDNIETDAPVVARKVISKDGHRGVQFGIIRNGEIELQKLVLNPSQARHTLIIKELYKNKSL